MAYLEGNTDLRKQRAKFAHRSASSELAYTGADAAGGGAEHAYVNNYRAVAPYAPVVYLCGYSELHPDYVKVGFTERQRLQARMAEHHGELLWMESGGAEFESWIHARLAGYRAPDPRLREWYWPVADVMHGVFHLSFDNETGLWLPSGQVRAWRRGLAA